VLPGDERRQRFLGTLTPTLRLGIDGEQTQIRGTLDHRALASGAETLSSVGGDWSLPAGELDPEPGVARTASRREDGSSW